MRPTWVNLQCPACGRTWEAEPADLPPPEEDFTCDNCGTDRPTAEFMRTERNLEMLRDLQEG
jgi:tRNA(Ile2) C34 agmatinyltransferase TiaS